MSQRMARRRISRIRPGFTARRAVKDATRCGSLQFPVRSGARMVGQAPARDRMSPIWQLLSRRHFGHWTAGRSRRARQARMAFDSQRGSTSSRMTHRLSLGHITDYWGRPVMRRRRQHSDTGSFKPLFLLCGPTPEEKNWKKNEDM